MQQTLPLACTVGGSTAASMQLCANTRVHMHCGSTYSVAGLQWPAACTPDEAAVLVLGRHHTPLLMPYLQTILGAGAERARSRKRAEGEAGLFEAALHGDGRAV